MPCVLVNSLHCQHFYLSQSFFSRSNSLTTDSINSTWRNLCGFWLSQHSVLKCLTVRHQCFLVFMSLLWILNLVLTSMTEPIYWSSVFTRNQVDNITAVTRKIAFDILNLPIILHLNLLPVNKKFLQMSYFLHSLSNSRQHSANANVIADMKSKITVSRRQFFADVIFSATSKVQNYQNKTLLHISRNFKDIFKYICFTLYL